MSVDYWTPPVGVDVDEPEPVYGVDPADALQVLPPGVQEIDAGLWLGVRRTGIGASDVSGILGLNRYTSRFEVYADKCGEIPWEDPDGEAAEMGVLLEPVIRDWYSRTKLPHGQYVATHGGTLRSVRWPWLVCNPDGIVLNRGGGERVATREGYEGKALDVATPMLTTAGWTTMGALRVGDEVYHPDGHPVRVVGAYAPMTNHDCYRVTTTDGRSVVADGEHLWTVRTDSGQWQTITTAEIIRRGLIAHDRPRGRQYRFILPYQDRLITKPVDLPVDPYVLGAWLGDGSAGRPAIHVGDEDVADMEEQVDAAGYRVRSTRRLTAWEVYISTDGGPSFGALCRDLGAWESKTVPPIYLMAGTEQRLALLQGLLDTDGSISERGQVSFSACRRDLAEAVLFLARSLGFRAGLHTCASLLNGQRMQDRHVVRFTPTADDPEPFRLARKAARVQYQSVATRARRHPRIRSIEPVASRPVRCIHVDRLDGLFLAGRDLVPTHNTTTVWLADEWAEGQTPDHAEVQCQVVMAVCGFVGMHVACCIGGQRRVTRYVERDDELISDIVDITGEFWHDHVLKGAPPEPDASVACADFLNRRYPYVQLPLAPVVASPADVEKIRVLRAQERAAATYVKAGDEGKNLARQRLGDAETLVDADGRTVATWRQTGRLDVAALREDHPELVAAFTRKVDVFDGDAFAQAHPALHRAYRRRVLLVK